MRTEPAFPLVAAIGIAAVAIALAGCGQPTIGREAYDVAKAIHTVVNQQQTEKLPQVREYVTASHREGRLNDDEHAALIDAVVAAEAGDWQPAEASLRSLLAAQNRE